MERTQREGAHSDCMGVPAQRSVAAAATGCTDGACPLGPPRRPLLGPGGGPIRCDRVPPLNFQPSAEAISRMRNNGGTRGPSSDKVCCSGIERQASGHGLLSTLLGRQTADLSDPRT
jgi:hypothetical protein